MSGSEDENERLASSVTLQQREARLRRAQEVAHIGSWEIDLRTGWMWGSEEAFRIYGLEITPGQAMPLDQVQAIPVADYRPLLDAALRALIESQTPYDVEYRIRRPSDGALRDIHARAELVVDAEGRPLRVDGTAQDVTERKAMEQALKASEARLRMVVEHAADAFLLGKPNGDLIGANDRVCELTGYTREELLTRNIAELFASEVLRAEPLRYDLVERGDLVRRERLLTRKDGTQVPIEMLAKKLPDGTLQAILRDTTERLRLEEQLRLRERMAAMGTLAGGIAHDFNNLLAVIMGYADLVATRGHALDANQRDSIDHILTACRRGADLVRSLGSFARSDAGEMKSFEVGRVVEEVVRVLDQTTDKLILKELIGPRRDRYAHGNESEVYHSLVNVGINAIQAIERQGARHGDRVTFETGDEEVARDDPRGLAPGRYVHLVVRDTGPGMPPEVRARAFEPLFTTRDKGPTKGQGLGLAMAYNAVVHHHGGAIEIDAAPARGTAVHILLPAGEPVQPIAEPPPTASAGEGRTVLVVEDEEALVGLARRVLESAGYRVLCAVDGLEGLEVFRQNAQTIDAVVLDRTLPKMAGETLLAEMLAIDPNVAVIVSSGDASLELRAFPGARKLLRKPFLPQSLSDAVAEVLRDEAGA